jgi:hypothetical protein
MKHQSSHITALGIIFLLYGILKLALVFSVTFFIPKHIQKDLAKIEGMDLIISGDHTVAGKVVEWLLAAFGVFSIIHGLALMDVFSARVNTLVESKMFQYSVYTILGVFLIVFYTLVLYTSLPIPKVKENYDKYWIYGYIGGGSFLLVPIIWELVSQSWPILSRMSKKLQLALITLTFFIIAFIVYEAYKKQITTKTKHNSSIK